MKILKILTVGALLLTAFSCKKAPVPPTPEEIVPKVYATIKEALEDIPGATITTEDVDAGQFVLSFTQPVDHKNAANGTFTQRVAVLFRGFDRPTILETEGYMWTENAYDIAGFGPELEANVIHVEHRNYGKSNNSDKGRWQYQSLAQASADLHSVFLAFKKFLPGKWMSHGVSKSGETAVDYQYFYPDDMDLATCFCAPFMTTLTDTRFGDYLFEVSGTAQERATMVSGIQKYLEGGEDGLYKKAAQKCPNLSYSEYVFDVFDMYFTIFQYRLAKDRPLYLQLAGDDATMEDAVVNAIKSNRDEGFLTYFVDTILEQGFPWNGYERFQNYLEGTSFSQENVLRAFLPADQHWIIDAYDNTVREDMRKNFFPTTTRPLLLVYAKDDPWTAAQPDPTHLSPSCKYIFNPVGVHNARIDKEEYYPKEIKDQILSYIRTYIY